MTANDLNHVARWCVAAIPVFWALGSLVFVAGIISDSLVDSEFGPDFVTAMSVALAIFAGCLAAVFMLASWAVSA